MLWGVSRSQVGMGFSSTDGKQTGSRQWNSWCVGSEAVGRGAGLSPACHRGSGSDVWEPRGRKACSISGLLGGVQCHGNMKGCAAGAFPVMGGLSGLCHSVLGREGQAASL